jgi:hypothetical protein
VVDVGEVFALTDEWIDAASATVGTLAPIVATSAMTVIALAERFFIDSPLVGIGPEYEVNFGAWCETTVSSLRISSGPAKSAPSIGEELRDAFNAEVPAALVGAAQGERLLPCSY